MLRCCDGDCVLSNTQCAKNTSFMVSGQRHLFMVGIAYRLWLRHHHHCPERHLRKMTVLTECLWYVVIKQPGSSAVQQCTNHHTWISDLLVIKQICDQLMLVLFAYTRCLSIADVQVKFRVLQGNIKNSVLSSSLLHSAMTITSGKPLCVRIYHVA